MTYTLNKDGFYHIPLVDFGHRLKNNFGLDIVEHPEFGGVKGKHADNSYHDYGEAIDIRDNRTDVIDGVSWQTRTGNLQNLLKGSGPEIIGPNSGDPDHSTHLHLAATGGILKFTPEQYNTFFGGKAGGKLATFGSHVPGADDQPVAVDSDSPTQTTPQQEAVERAQNYVGKSKAELDAAYDGMRNDPVKAETEGMKMHKAFFGKK